MSTETYVITHKEHISNERHPRIEAIVGSVEMSDPSTLPPEWPAGSLIYTTGYAVVKTKGLDGTWTEVS